LFKICHGSIAVGKIYKDWYEELHGAVVRNRMVVIPNGVPEVDIPEDIDYLELRKKQGLEPDAFIALFFGTMDFAPNLEAAKYLYEISQPISKQFEKKTGKKLIFAVAGRGSKALLPRADWYRPIGFVEKLSDLYSLPDAIVIPHLPTLGGTHVKTIYSFQSGKPVIATDNAVRGMPHVYPQKHFLIFDSDHPDTLLTALIDLYNNSELGKRLAKNGQRYAQKYSWKSISSLHMKLYEKLGVADT
jgi:glycosyltransferase involved in cell wall biosynthesis